jgi:hypothetical protein
MRRAKSRTRGVELKVFFFLPVSVAPVILHPNKSENLDGAVLSVSDLAGPDALRFYRVKVLP